MKVLIIDDDKSVRAIYGAAFKKENIEVDVASNGEEGLEILRKSNPDIVLLDMLMPKMGGLEVLENLKKNKEKNSMPVIIFSSLRQEEDIKKVMSLGAKKYLSKDEFSPREMVNEVKKVLVFESV